MTDETAPNPRDQHISAWRQAKATLQTAAEFERKWRDYVAAENFGLNPAKGTHRIELGSGYQLKLQQPLSYTLGNRDAIDPLTQQKIPIADQVDAILAEISALGNEGPMLADRLVKWEPKLVESEYNKLNIEFDIERKTKELIDSILTIKLGAPQLEFVEPKANCRL